jgi:uncharacterized protein (DUF927 family)
MDAAFLNFNSAGPQKTTEQLAEIFERYPEILREMLGDDEEAMDETVPGWGPGERASDVPIEGTTNSKGIEFRVGDMVNAMVNGVLVFESTRRIARFHHDGSQGIHAELEGLNGDPNSVCNIEHLEHPRKQPPPPPPDPPEELEQEGAEDATSAVAIARGYLARGWNLVPVPYKTKKPVMKDWGNHQTTSDNVEKLFRGKINVGGILGPSSKGLTDNDLDWPEASIIAPYVMPHTGAIFGRKGKRNSHRLYETNLATTVDTAAIQRRDPILANNPDPEDKAMICELRIGGAKAAQTVLPGSVHESGEPIKWEERGEPAKVNDDLILQRFNLLAAGSLLARYWPKQGARHHTALIIGGFLARAGVDRGAADGLIQGICTAAGDPEPRDRKQAVADAYKSQAAGTNTYGYPALETAFGKEVAKAVADWIGYGGPRSKDSADDPEGFEMRENGLYVIKTIGRGKNTTTVDIWVCSPFEVLQRERSPDGKGWARRLSWKDHDKRPQTYLVPDARLHSDPGELCGELASNGLTISIGKHRDLITYINRKSSASRGTIVERTGWHEIAGKRCFVMPDMVIGGVDKVTLQGSTSRPYAVSGTLEEWQTHVADKAIGHRYLTFMLSCGFVGPLLELLEMESGGVHPHGASSIGKTTGNRMAVTPWGSGADRGGFLKSWAATRNGLEGSAIDHADTLLALEELGIANPKELGSCVYSLASGLGKQRADRTGALRSPKTWRSWIISSGEVTLRALMAAGGQRVRAGQEIRIVDIRADQGDGLGVFNKAGPGFNPKAFADELKLATCRYYGTAGPAFVAKLLEHDRDRIKRFWDKMRQAIPEKAKLSSGTEQVWRVADKFSLIATAGALATEFGILPWPPGSAMKSVAEMLDGWVKSRGGAKDPQEVTAGINQVRGLIAAHGNSRFEHIGQHASARDDAPRVNNRLGWFSGSGQDQRWYVLPSIFKDTFCEGFDHTILREALHAYGMLERDPDGKHWPKNEWCDGRTQRVYVLTAKLLQEEGSD